MFCFFLSTVDKGENLSGEVLRLEVAKGAAAKREIMRETSGRRLRGEVSRAG